METSAEHSLLYEQNKVTVPQGFIGKNLARQIRIALVDDEPLARRALRRVVSEIPGIEIIGECANGEEALTMLPMLQPDLIFLDVEMPRIDGMELARTLREKQDSCIVFITAHEKYALDAFAVEAVDYLLKPINEAKIYKVVERVVERLRQKQNRNIDTRLESIIHLIEHQKMDLQPAVSLDRITIKNNGRIYFIETSSIDWIEAEGNYVTFHTGTGKHLLRMKMSQLEQSLNPILFVRVHRSTIVNCQSIKELRSYFNGAYMILLNDGTKLYSSRGYRKKVEQILHQNV